MDSHNAMHLKGHFFLSTPAYPCFNYITCLDVWIDLESKSLAFSFKISSIFFCFVSISGTGYWTNVDKENKFYSQVLAGSVLFCFFVFSGCIFIF